MQPCVQIRRMAKGMDNIDNSANAEEGKPEEMQQLQNHQPNKSSKQDPSRSFYKAKTRSLQFLVSARVASDPRVDILFIFAMKRCPNCSQNRWIDWIVPCCVFKRLFHIGVWTFARFVMPLLASILWVMGNLIPAYTCRLSRISMVGPRKYWH